MLDKKDRTLELYKKAGAEIRLLKTLGGKLVEDMGGLLNSVDVDKLFKALDIISCISSKAEENMFRDHNALGRDYIDVFYGAIYIKPKNDVDKEIIEMARSVADELFERKECWTKTHKSS